MDKLIALGFTNKTLNEWKLKLYKNNVDDCIKYYDSDSFCFQYFLFGSCNTKQKCKAEHKQTVTQLIHENILNNRLILEYLEWYYNQFRMSYSAQHQSKIYEYLGDTYKYLPTSNTIDHNCNYDYNYASKKSFQEHYKKSCQYYVKSFELSKEKNINCLIKHAQLLDRYLFDWPKSIQLYLQAIKLVSSTSNMIAKTKTKTDSIDHEIATLPLKLHESFAKALKHHGMFNEAISHFIECISIINTTINGLAPKVAIDSKATPIDYNNVFYFEEISYCLCRQAASMFPKCLAICYNILRLRDSSTNNLDMSTDKINIEHIFTKCRRIIDNIKKFVKDSDGDVPLVQKCEEAKSVVIDSTLNLETFCNVLPVDYNQFVVCLKPATYDNNLNYVFESNKQNVLPQDKKHMIEKQGMCYQWVLTGKCIMDSSNELIRCNGHHNSKIVSLIVDKRQYHQAWDLCIYYQSFLKTSNVKAPYIHAALLELFGDIYNFGGKNNTDHQLADIYYYEAIKMFRDYAPRLAKHAQLLDTKLKDWERSKKLFEMSIGALPDRFAYGCYRYGVALCKRNELDQSIKYLLKGIKICENKIECNKSSLLY